MGHLCYLYLVFVMILRLFNAALWAPAVKGLTSWFSFVILIVFLSHFSMWYPWSGMVLDCIDS